MFDNLLEKGHIKLPKSKHPKDIGTINNPKYCRYHRIINHSIENYRTFKERVMQFAKKEKITLDENTEEAD